MSDGVRVRVQVAPTLWLVLNCEPLALPLHVGRAWMGLYVTSWR